MTNWFKRNYKTIIRLSYIIPILVAAGISIFHVISWYEITNPIGWAMYLSIGIEIAALSSLAGMTVRMNKWVYLPFIFVTFIQLLGNVYASYSYIDVNSDGFIKWIELTNPIFEQFGWVEEGSIIQHKRILGYMSGTFIPLISLSFLHLLISFNDRVIKENEVNDDDDDVGFINETDGEDDTVSFNPNNDDTIPYNSINDEIPNDDVNVNSSKVKDRIVDNKETENSGDNNIDRKDVNDTTTTNGDGRSNDNEGVDTEISNTTKKNKKPAKTVKKIGNGNKIKREDIDEVKKRNTNRGFSVNIPKPKGKRVSNNSIGRVDES